MAKCRQPRDVVIGPGGQNKTDGWDEAGGEAAAAEDDVDQGASGASVPVGEGVDGLELGVGDRGLNERRVLVSIDVGGEVLEQLGDVLGRWGHERCATEVV